jgi:hypothetical protein
MEEQLQLPRWPGGVRWLRGVDLVNLTRAAPLHRDIGDLYATVTKATPGVTLPDFLGALSVLVAFGALKHP